MADFQPTHGFVLIVDLLGNISIGPLVKVTDQMIFYKKPLYLGSTEWSAINTRILKSEMIYYKHFHTLQDARQYETEVYGAEMRAIAACEVSIERTKQAIKREKDAIAGIAHQIVEDSTT